MILNKKSEQKLKNVSILCATHFQELELLESIFPKNKVYHLGSDLDKNNRLQHTFTLETGVTPFKTYGISWLIFNA